MPCSFETYRRNIAARVLVSHKNCRAASPGGVGIGPGVGGDSSMKRTGLVVDIL